MYINEKKLGLVLLITFSSILSFAQIQKVKYGKVLISELEQTYYSQDSSAIAVVLYDRGHFKGNDFTFYRHKRIKILKKAGTSYANFSLRVPSKGAIRGVVFNLVNGVVVEEKLKKSDIHTEELFEGDFVYKIFMPNVREGSIIDISYSHYSLPYEWRFQDLIPTKYSELNIDDSPYINFSQHLKGFEKITTVGTKHWVAKDIPALKIEPLSNHYSNYLSKMEFQLLSVSIPGYYREYSSSWEVVGKRLLEYEYFGGVIRSSYFLNQKAKELKALEISTEEKVQLAFDYIQENIKWNNLDGQYARLDYRENFTKSHSGSSADINLILLSLLKKIDIKAYPVVLSTRNNGVISSWQPSSRKINYVIAKVEEEGYNKFLDASDEYGTPGIIPKKCLNGGGWKIIDPGKGEWVLIKQDQSRVIQYVQIDLKEQNDYAIINNSYTNHTFLDWFKNYKHEGTEELMAKRIENENKIIIDGYKVKSLDKSKARCSETFKVKIDDYIDDLGDEIIINPFIMTSLAKNPFKSDQRRLPIDLNYLKRKQSIINISIPNGYTISSLPKPLGLTLPEGSINFKIEYSYLETINSIQINYFLDIRRVHFNEEEYFLLKEFYSQAINKMSESIHLIKKS